MRGSLGKVAMIQKIEKGAIASSLVIIRPKAKSLLNDFLFRMLKSESAERQIIELQSGVAQPNLSVKSLKQFKIPLPPIEVQKQLVAEAEKEEEIIASNCRLIDLMEEKIGTVLQEI